MSQVMDKLQPWIEAVEQRPQGGPRWLQDLRDRGAARFAALGFPTVRDEEWRFTNVAPLAAIEFTPAAPVGDISAELDALPYANIGWRLVVVNGRFSAELSRLNHLPTGVRAGSLAAAVNEHADVVPRYLGQLADVNTRAFAALNTALAGDGAYLYIPDGVVLERPLQILYVSAGGVEPEMSQARTLIVAGERSQSQIAETYTALRGTTYFTNAVSEIFAAEGAVIDHYKVQHEGLQAFHVASLHLHAQRGATVSSHSFSLGGRFVRNDALATLDGEGAGSRSTASTWPTASGWSTTTPRSTTPKRTARATRSTRASSAARHARSSTARSSSAPTRRRPTPSRPTARCCSRTARRSTRSRSSRSSPTT
jgi:Fe-S cluster assembly protein SufD